MKKLLTYLLILSCFFGLLSATPCSCMKHQKISEITLVKSVSTNVSISADDAFAFHPLDILTLRIK